ncbi:MAG: saccharopine dehydrogenase NADP-binding domain-containing protein [Candidatus Nanopelagicales bacterium]|nr:saccharopine dehydrogenase NADP-binding domain-containing protein [Candidatus Nanopelagicales bacterium]
MGAIVVIGGYGNAGRAVVKLLRSHTDRPVVVAGRNRDRALALTAALADPRVTAAQADATDPESLAALLADAEVLVVAAGTSDTWQVTAEAALAAGCHQLDIQIGSAKNAGLRGLDARAREAGVSIVTDCGFHPGVPAAMVRAAAAGRPRLAHAVVSSWIALDWSALGAFSDSTVAEMVAEFADYRYEALVDGAWVAPRGTRRVTFPPPVGAQRVAAMGLDEMRAVAAALPGLRDTGFYVGGFPSVVSYGVIPLVYAGMKVAPRRAARPMGRLLDLGLRRCSRPPYATFLQLDGGADDQPIRPLMRLRHDDAYLLTAAPVVATIRQVLADPRPGVHLQGMLVEPTTFFADLVAMGVEVWAQPAPTGSGPPAAPGRPAPGP